jgi:flagellar basal-body rod protein FlgG
MIDAIYIAGSGIKCQQDYVNTISNNIANINTIGYKKNDVSFAEMTDSRGNADGVDDFSR